MKATRPITETLTAPKGEEKVTCAQWAARLRKARKLLTEAEHHALGEQIEKGVSLMRREHLR